MTCLLSSRRFAVLAVCNPFVCKLGLQTSSPCYLFVCVSLARFSLADLLLSVICCCVLSPRLLAPVAMNEPFESYIRIYAVDKRSRTCLLNFKTALDPVSFVSESLTSCKRCGGKSVGLGGQAIGRNNRCFFFFLCS